MDRVCYRCKIKKDISLFPKNKSEGTGYGYMCKLCRKQYVYGKYSQASNQWKRNYYNKNKNKIRTRDNESRRKRERTPEGKIIKAKQDSKFGNSLLGRYANYKAGAKRRGLNFELSLEKFSEITNKDCFFCGKKSPNKLHVGIDRANAEEGYQERNCLPCCTVCNRMKSQMNVEEFFTHIKMIQERIK